MTTPEEQAKSLPLPQTPKKTLFKRGYIESTVDYEELLSLKREPSSVSQKEMNTLLSPDPNLTASGKFHAITSESKKNNTP